MLQMAAKDFTNPIVSKGDDGWRIEFKRDLPCGNNPQFFMRDGAAKIKMNRSGLFDPVDINGVSVFCTLSPDVFVPIQIDHQNMSVIATSAGAAFKIGDPETIEMDRDFITLLFDGGILPHDQPKKVDFSRHDLSEPFWSYKQKLLDAIMSGDENSIQKHIDLILLYLSNGFGSEAASEIKVLSQESSGIVDGVIEADVVNKLFSFHKVDLESAAWCALSLAQLEQKVIPYYLVEYLNHSIDTFPEPVKSMLLVSLSDRLILKMILILLKRLFKKLMKRGFLQKRFY